MVRQCCGKSRPEIAGRDPSRGKLRNGPRKRSVKDMSREGQGRRRETAVATNGAGTFRALMGPKLYVGSHTPPSHCPRR